MKKPKPFNPIASARFYANEAHSFLAKSSEFLKEAKEQDQLTDSEYKAVVRHMSSAQKELEELKLVI